jgi:hypothetical protein
MAEYIEREAFIKWVEETYCKPCEAEKKDYNHCRCGSCQYDDMMRDAESFCSADVQPVRHGRWKPYDLTYGRSIYYCTACNHSAEVPTVLDDPIFNYCPNCGARMDGGENNI